MNEHEFGGLSSFEPAPSRALPLTAKEDKQWASLAHFGGILGFVPAMVVYFTFRKRGPFTAQESKEAFNFALPLTAIIFVALIISAFVPQHVKIWFTSLALVMWLPLAAYSVVGGIRSNRGRPYQYPFKLNIISL